MTQQTSPFLEGKYGWSLGESNWNLGMDENLLKFSYMFDKNIDGIVSSLPAISNGNAYFLTTDNRLYFDVGSQRYSSPTPKWFVVTLRTTGEKYQFNGTSLATTGASWERFSHADTYPTSSLGRHSQAVVNVTDDPYNALTIGDATAAFQAAYDAAPIGGRIVVPAPGPFTVGTLTGTKFVTWEVQYNIQTNLGLLNLPGTVVGCINNAKSTYRSSGTNSDFALARFDRIANYSGGTFGFVNSNIRGYTNVSNNAATSFEWVGTFVMDNAGQGENVAVYGQANRLADSSVTLGGTFAGVFEARDKTQEANPTTGLIGLEVDVFANGTDSSNRRVIMDLVTGKGVGAGVAGEVGYGIRIGPTGGDASSSSIKNGIYLYGNKGAGVVITGTNTGRSIDISATGGTKGVVISGSNNITDFESASTTTYGMLFSGTYSSGVAIHLKTGDAIALEATDQVKVRHNGSLIEFLNGATVRQSFNTGTGAFSINGSQVLGPRDTGWAPMTGTANKNTTYDTATVTLAQLAGRVMALQAAFTTHGSLGA